MQSERDRRFDLVPGSDNWMRHVTQQLLLQEKSDAIKAIPDALISHLPPTLPEAKLSPSPPSRISFSIGSRQTSLNYHQDDAILQRHLLEAQGSLVEVKLGAQEEKVIIHLLDLRDSKANGIPANAARIEIIRYLRGALLFCHYNNLSNEVLSSLLQEYKRLLTQESNTAEEITAFHNKICRDLQISTKQLALARNLALQRLKPIPRVTFQKDQNGWFALHATTQVLDNQGIDRYCSTSVRQNIIKKSQPWLAGVSSKDREWVTKFLKENAKEIQDNGCYAPPAMAELPFPRNALTDTIYTGVYRDSSRNSTAESKSSSKQSSSPQVINERFSRIERLGITSPFKHPFRKAKDREARIQYGVDILLARIKPILTDRLIDHFKKYGNLYQSNPKEIDFSILYLTVLSPALWESVPTEFGKHADNNFLFIKEKEEIIKRVQQQILQNPGCVITPKNELVIQSNTVRYGNVKINLVLKDINNPINKWRIFSYSRNQDINDSNDLMNGVSADIGRLIGKPGRPGAKLTQNEIDTLYQLQYALSPPNVSIFGQAFGKADLFGRPWDKKILNQILDNLEKGDIQLTSGTFPPEGQIELAQRIKAAIHLRDVNHESVFMKLSRGFVGGIRKFFYLPEKALTKVPSIRKIPLIGSLCGGIASLFVLAGDIVAGATDWALNSVLANILSPFSSGMKAIRAFMSIWSFGSGHNAKLLKSSYEALTLGSKGVVLGFCKSSDDRTSILLSAVNAMICNPSLLDSEIGSKLYIELFAEMKKMIDRGISSHAICQHTYAVKVSDIGHPYVSQCISSNRLEQIDKLKQFRKHLETPPPVSVKEKKPSSPDDAKRNPPEQSSSESGSYASLIAEIRNIHAAPIFQSDKKDESQHTPPIGKSKKLGLSSSHAGRTQADITRGLPSETARDIIEKNQNPKPIDPEEEQPPVTRLDSVIRLDSERLASARLASERLASERLTSELVLDDDDVNETLSETRNDCRR